MSRDRKCKAFENYCETFKFFIITTDRVFQNEKTDATKIIMPTISATKIKYLAMEQTLNKGKNITFANGQSHKSNDLSWRKARFNPNLMTC